MPLHENRGSAALERLVKSCRSSAALPLKPARHVINRAADFRAVTPSSCLGSGLDLESVQVDLADHPLVLLACRHSDPRIRQRRHWTAHVVRGPERLEGGAVGVLREQRGDLYLAGDLTFVHNRLNSNSGGDTYKGNGVELYLQNDPYDPNRTAYDADHNWQLVIGLGPTPAMKLYGAVQAEANDNLGNTLLVTDKPDKKGVFLRANLPWSIFLKDDKKGSSAPADESLGAIGLAVDAADPNSDPTDTAVQMQLMGLAVGNTPWTDPSFLRPAVFTVKAP